MYKNKFGKPININKLLKDLKQNESKNIEGFDIRYNSKQHQFNNSECGVYSINFIVRLVSGESFDEITNNITKDPKMNECRKSYFRNVDFK